MNRAATVSNLPGIHAGANYGAPVKRIASNEVRLELGERYDLCIVGGGPNALYLIERVLARKLASPHTLSGLVISIFDRDGHFGSGCHYSTQPKTNHLNRIAAQISFGADITNSEQVTHLLPDDMQLTLFEWCEKKFNETGEERFKISEHSWVERALFGEASEEVFRGYVNYLHELGIECHLYTADVFDIAQNADYYTVFAKDKLRQFEIQSDFIVLCTGHGENRGSDTISSYADKSNGQAAIINYIYPLEAVDSQAIPSGSNVACRGLGLAAIDLLLWLTEGRGGYFSASGADNMFWSYRPSGFEPSKIFPFSGSGAFPLTRARNQKLNDVELMHRSIFFTYQAIDQMRLFKGVENNVQNVGPIRQLDFEVHILPLMITEMALVYYSVMFGERWLTNAINMLKPTVETYLQSTSHGRHHDDELAELFGPIDEFARSTAAAVGACLDGSEPDPSPEICDSIVSFAAVIYGKSASADLSRHIGSGSFQAQLAALFSTISPWAHNKDPLTHLFSWPQLVDPLAQYADCPPEARHRAAVALLRRDIMQAQQGNLDNPTKSAIDGVCRDIRDVLRYAVEFGGLTASSQRVFATKYQRLLNRLAVGTSLKIMRKILAIADHGIVDLSFSRNPKIVAGRDHIWRLENSDDSEGHVTAAVLVDARVHLFNLEDSRSELYANLVRRKMIRRWQNPDHAGNHFNAGGLDIVPRRHLVVSAQGTINPSFAALGVPTEGALYFHIAAQRPFCADPIVVDAENVLREVMGQMADVRQRTAVAESV